MLLISEIQFDSGHSQVKKVKMVFATWGSRGELFRKAFPLWDSKFELSSYRASQIMHLYMTYMLFIFSYNFFSGYEGIYTFIDLQ